MDYRQGHVTSQPVPETVVPAAATVYVDPPGSTTAAVLTSAEIARFKRDGFIVKRGLIDAPATFARVIDHVWKNAPTDTLVRDDPTSWCDSHDERWTQADAARVGSLSHGNWKMRSRGPAGIGTEPFLVDEIANHPNMLQVAAEFIGGPVKRARRVRGIYCVLPNPIGSPGRYGPHADYMAAHVAAMVFADQVPARTGGFTVWPGSHERLHPIWDTVLGSSLSEAASDRFKATRDTILRDTTPVEFTGDAGDVVFWHPRALHSAGINRSAEDARPRVRVIVPCDYQRAGRDYFDDLEFGPGPEVQWWIDTRNFHGDAAPTQDNLWSDWAI